MSETYFRSCRSKPTLIYLWLFSCVPCSRWCVSCTMRTALSRLCCLKLVRTEEACLCSATCPTPPTAPSLQTTSPGEYCTSRAVCFVLLVHKWISDSNKKSPTASHGLTATPPARVQASAWEAAKLSCPWGRRKDHWRPPQRRDRGGRGWMTGRRSGEVRWIR